MTHFPRSIARFDAFSNLRTLRWLPVFAATLARETHVSDLTGNQTSKIQISFNYSDGFDREIQTKIQAEPGPVEEKGPIIDPRWVGNGWTIFNNKGNPVRQYEPFFSQLLVRGHQFEFGVQMGVSPILCYDPLDRVVAIIQPNHTYAKVVFDPWHQLSSDANDTVLETDPVLDPDVGAFFRRLAYSDFAPTWYSQRIAGALGLQALAAFGAEYCCRHHRAPFENRSFLAPAFAMSIASSGSSISQNERC